MTQSNAAKWNRFTTLRGYEGGRLWKELNAIHPREIDIGLFELPEEPPSSPESLSQRLYHYTDIHGLAGILESNSLWASAAHYLNDSSEIEYGCRLLLNELPRWIEPNKESTRFAAVVLKALQNIFVHPGSKLSRSLNIFVTCFCENDNLLSQWRAYGQKGGYALGFRVSNNLGLKSAGPFDLRLLKVIYNQRKQVQRIRAVLRDSILAVDAEFKEELPSDNNLSNDVVLMIEELLLDEIVSFKHPAFVDEREWRLVARFDSRRISEGSAGSQKQLFKFRASGGHMLPYIELEPANGKLPLTSLRFGPSLDFKRYEDPTRLLLAMRGFHDVEVIGSDLPVIL
jgi:hypothetical protein